MFVSGWASLNAKIPLEKWGINFTDLGSMFSFLVQLESLHSKNIVYGTWY